MAAQSLPKSANIKNDARADLRALGFWQDNVAAFFDTRVFYPFAQTYLDKTLESAYKMHEKEKKRDYQQRIRHVEHGTFTPLVFSSYGTCNKETTIVLKKLASMLADKNSTEYAQEISLLRTRLSFEFMRSAQRCLRGTRHYRSKTTLFRPAPVVIHEAGISL